MPIKNVVGLFDNANDAQTALRQLRDAGFPADDISFVGSNTRGDYGAHDATTRGDYGAGDTTARDGTDTEAEEGAGFGATGGAVLGGLAGLLVGIGALAIPGVGPVVAAGGLATALGSTALGAGLGAAAGGLVGALVGAGIPEEHANVYAESVRRGGTLIVVQAGTDDEADRAADIMDDNHAVDIDRRAEEYRGAGWERFNENAEPYDRGATPSAGTTTVITDYDTGAATHASAMGSATDYGTTERRTDYVETDRTPAYTETEPMAGYETDRAGVTGASAGETGEQRVPIIEEQLHVGKRDVERGGVQVTTSVEEVPVNEQVTLRDETVSVDRRPVDRPVGDAELNAFQEGTFEVRERDEEAVVAKEARVVEELHVEKTVQERTETVSDTVRRTDVDVEQLGTDETTRARGSNVEGGVEPSDRRDNI